MVGLSVLLHRKKTALSRYSMLACLEYCVLTDIEMHSLPRTNTFIDTLIFYAVERFILIT